MTMSAANSTEVPATLGRFLLLRLLGQGGMGMVYEAYDPNLDRRVALKLVRADRGGSQGKQRLLREAQVLARLSHPNVVPIHEVGVIDDQVFLVMEYVSGMTLRQWVAAKERPWQEIVATYCQAARGLAAAHAAGLVHRDFKPDNVLIGEDGRVRVLDFGLARAQASEASSSSQDGSLERVAMADMNTAILGQSDTWVEAAPEGSGSLGQTPMNQTLTETGAMVGTPAYMAPEQFDGKAVGPAADQFSLCLALYEALYGQKPFQGATLMHMQVMMREGAVRPPPQDAQVPRWLFALLRRGLSVNPDERHPSMDAFIAELSRDRESDLSITRRAATRFISGFGVICAIVAALVTMRIPIGRTEPVSLGMLLIAASLVFVFAVGLGIWRRSLMVNDAARKFLISMLALMGVITLQRFVGWQNALTMYHQVIGEYFTLAAGAVVGMITLLRRLWVMAMWMVLSALVVILWPERLLVGMTMGFNGIVIIPIWIWLGERDIAKAGY